MELTATLALVVSTAAALFTWATASEQRKTRIDDKFPYIVVRSRKRQRASDTIDELRLVNVGRGPAFITKFVVKGLDMLDGIHSYTDGDHTDEIDRVIGPEIGNPDLQCWFAWGTPQDIRADSPRPEKVSIGIAYKDIGGRLFRSGIINGKPVWDPPLDFSHTRFCLWTQKFCGKEETEESVNRLRAFLGTTIV
jgi:hypothetical protein